METERKRVPKEDLNLRMFLKLMEFFKEYVYFRDPVCYVLCLIYAIVTYLLDVWDEVPYLKIFGLPGRGKSLLGELFALLCFNSLKSEDISDAFLYRKIAEGEIRVGVTLIIDEKDDLSSKHQGLLLSILRGGYRRGGKVSRCGPGGRLEEFSTFSPKIIVNIRGILDPALGSRTIPIQMFRREGQLVRFRFRRAQKEFNEARNLINWFVEHHRDLISESYNNFEGVEGLILRPIRSGHAEGVEVRLSARAGGTLKPEVVSHETEEVDGGREVGHCHGRVEGQGIGCRYLSGA